ncbi:hypothetical protein BN903_181 [Halorubrum sp. AJ67]|nr:hypothetical protein BN903_181 [Halorubrum sp. AJ67]
MGLTRSFATRQFVRRVSEAEIAQEISRCDRRARAVSVV